MGSVPRTQFVSRREIRRSIEEIDDRDLRLGVKLECQTMEGSGKARHQLGPVLPADPIDYASIMLDAQCQHGAPRERRCAKHRANHRSAGRQRTLLSRTGLLVNYEL